MKLDCCSTFEVTIGLCIVITQGFQERCVILNYNSTKCHWLSIAKSKFYSISLLRNGNLYNAVLIGHSVCLREEYWYINVAIGLLHYHKHYWIICIDFKVVSFLLGQQCRYTKFPSLLRMRESRNREKHCAERIWRPVSDRKPDDPNCPMCLMFYRFGRSSKRNISSEQYQNSERILAKNFSGNIQAILLISQTILVMSSMSKVNNSTKIWRSMRTGIRIDGI